MVLVPIAAIINPRSANGKTGRIWPEVFRELQQAFGPIQVFNTQAPNHAIELSAQAVRTGYQTILTVGGDGTVSEVVNGFFQASPFAAPGTILGIIPQGTGSDFRRAIHLPLDTKAAIRALRAAEVKTIDVMRVSYRDWNGNLASRYGVNLASFGMGGAVAARANAASKVLGGKVSFLIATAAVAMRFSGNVVSLRMNGSELLDVAIQNVAVGNGPYHGGGMWVCPRAILDDGWLDVTVMKKLFTWEILRDIAYLYNGRIYEHPKVRHYRVKHLQATSDQPTFIEIDGEPLGHLPLEITVIPRVLHVLVPPT
ncbi:MAG: diacylglycerol kinase family lipid kinase [Acidobacteria bacterium]|nr:diacylglycerol kinase family lipid kinase [Acidobacteriota bacterium]